jgi:hypothetical protein
MLKNFIIFLLFSTILNPSNSAKFLHKNHRKNFHLLRDFTCEVAKDELNKNPDMRTIALIELESDFPPNFSREILKCLPVEVTKIILMPHTPSYRNNSVVLGKSSMAIYLSDKFNSVRNKISFKC